MTAAAQKLSPKRDMAPWLIPVLAEEDGLFYTKMGEVGFALISDPLWAVDSHTAARINGFLNMDWPNNSAIQIISWSGPDITRELNDYMALRPDDMQAMPRVRAEFIRKGTIRPLYDRTLVRNTKLIITFKTKLPKGGMRRIPPSFLENIRNLKATAMESLHAVGLAVEEISPDAMLRLYRTFFSRTEEADWRYEFAPYSDLEPFDAQVFDYDSMVELDSSSIRVGEDTIKVLSIKRFPEYMNFGDAFTYVNDPLGGGRGIPENVLLTASIIFPDREKAVAAIESKRAYVQHQAVGKILEHIPELAELKHSFDAIHDAVSEGDRPVYLYLGLSLFVPGQDRARVAAAVSNARTYWRDNGFQLVEDKFVTLPAFLNQLPFGVDLDGYKDLYRFKTMATRHATPMLPVFGDWKGTGTPALLFVSRGGQLIKYSLYDSDSNFNLTIAAQSGSGKSFLTNELIITYYMMGGIVWMIDVGRSYEKLCKAIGGQFMVFTKDSDICLNPFTMVQDYEEEADIITGLLQAMAAPTQPLSDFQASRLRRVTGEVWSEKGRSTTIDDIAEALLADSDRRVQDIGHQLYPFTSKGEYGRFFHGENNVKLNSRFTVLELEELKGKEHLQQVVLLQLIYQIQQEMYLGRRDRPKLMLVDEAWDLLTKGNVGKFIETGYRRFRKYGGSAVTITQSINDLYTSPGGRAIAESSAHKWLLGQQAETIDQLRKEQRLPLSDGGYQLLKTVKTMKGKYSEIFFLSPFGSGIGRLVVSDFYKLLYSTDPKDVHAIDTYREQGLSVEDAIREVIKDRGGRL